MAGSVVTPSAIDPALVADIAAMERALLLDPDFQALQVYADMLEDAERGVEARWVRGLSGCAADEVAGIADSVRENGYAVGSDFTRRAIACLLAAAHPVESAELRLSVAAGSWPAALSSLPYRAGELWVSRHLLREGRVSWHVGVNHQPPGEVVWSSDKPYWHASLSAKREPQPTKRPENANAAVCAITRRWIEGLLDAKDGGE